VAGELAPFGAPGFQQLLGVLGAGAPGIGEGICGGQGSMAGVAEGAAFAGGVGADVPGLGAGISFGLPGVGGLGGGSLSGLAGCAGGLVAFAFAACGMLAGCGELDGVLAAEGGELCPGLLMGAGGLLACGLGGGFGGAGCGALGVERLGESAGLLEGFGGLGLGGGDGGLGAPAGGFGLGELGADSGRVKRGGLLAGRLDQRGCLPDQGVQDGVPLDY
jgi:hypothetical protein